MKERPILFSGPMVRALLDGGKTQTRRVVKPEGANHLFQFRGTTAAAGADEPTGEWAWCGSEHVVNKHIFCPYGRPGDRLWVRETFRGCRAYEVQGYPPKDWGNKPIWFEADGTAPGSPEFWAKKARPSIHMPRWASRITLEITEVRVERLQDISEVDSIAEGVEDVTGQVAPADPDLTFWRRYQDGGVSGYTDNPIASYASLWTQINGPGSWEANPWVWVVSFRRLP